MHWPRTNAPSSSIRPQPRCSVAQTAGAVAGRSPPSRHRRWPLPCSCQAEAKARSTAPGPRSVSVSSTRLGPSGAPVLFPILQRRERGTKTSRERACVMCVLSSRLPPLPWPVHIPAMSANCGAPGPCPASGRHRTQVKSAQTPLRVLPHPRVSRFRTLPRNATAQRNVIARSILAPPHRKRACCPFESVLARGFFVRLRAVVRLGGRFVAEG